MFLDLCNKKIVLTLFSIGYGLAEDLHSLVLAMGKLRPFREMVWPDKLYVTVVWLARVIEHTTSIVEFGISLPSLGVQEIKRLCAAATKHGQLEALRQVQFMSDDDYLIFSKLDAATRVQAGQVWIE